MSEVFVFRAPVVRRYPMQKGSSGEFDGVETHVFRIRAVDVPAGLPTDANPRDPNLNRQVYRQVRASLLGTDGSPTGGFHLKHGGVVLIAESVTKIGEDTYEVAFGDEGRQGIANGGHSYEIILDAQKTESIPADQLVEFKVHTGVPGAAVVDLADGLNTSMQVRAESLADLGGHFEWLKDALSVVPGGADHVAWHEGDSGEYDVREVVALLMALDPTRYPIDGPVGIENTYARLSSVFKVYLSDEDRVRSFGAIAAEAMALYECIRCTAVEVMHTLQFRRTDLAEKKPNGAPFVFHYFRDVKGAPQKSDVRLTKAAAVVAFTAFRTLVNVTADGLVTWHYPFQEILRMWDEHGDELLREFHAALRDQFRYNQHYAGRSPMSYRASTRTLEVADLRRRLAKAE